METSMAQAKAEVVVGGVLFATPLWSIVLQDVSLIASTVATICGAIVGVHAVWRLKRRTGK
jgi:hypothetical protein